ncbi:hypothetical protein A3H38_00415 [candidate division WOR-1 bacterium RIFCSPLOWO2_02_FULL_46_20]|uniref:YoaR-like putative peptidoglycan binding domain-containing protein n=2 Tax=Saganbacteria TaxID=1703751 RepID=A0A1F4RFL7_UNCSA|nr:MAG: hypothetical protein A3J44_06415 [candidate division WOR-1 bacterium RIFCSPHIGHO2_02_FULL_45_12]OGC06979.1 MAG: hypothetical protein A3H38_00415 [candidate division WOR-1 bacterium RIFCSPLOWO2_02_FULL_46_20]OGC09500.1 MAG: hypothetical protein A3F86_02675 [candidate division WOR-1 bacterium RIFCSPLOWO2_12_FULL_45_9]
MRNLPELEENTFENIEEPGSGAVPFSFIHSVVHTILKIVGGFAITSVIVAMSFVSYDYIMTRHAFPAQTYIGNVDVSGLTQGEGIAKLKSLTLAQIFSPLITLETDNASFSFAPDELGVFVLYQDTVTNTFKITHKENYVAELKERIAKGEFVTPLILSIDETRLKAVLEELANEIRSSPKNATMLLYEETGGYHIESEDLGRELDVHKSVDIFKTALNQGKTSVPLELDFTYPHVREKDLRAHPPAYRLSAYTTYYGKHDSPNRIHNIKLIASWIDDTILMPGERLSVADVIGDVTSEKGFKQAFVIVGGELVPLLGGGACQVATTLFNAVALADLKVLSRRNHSFYFSIYPLGRDAGVYPGQLDFQFKNDSGYPILIKSVYTNKRLSFRLYGTPDGKKVEFSPVSILGLSGGKYVPMSLGRVIATDVPFKTFVTRTVWDKEGKEIKKEVISSFYKLYGEKTNVPVRRPEPR